MQTKALADFVMDKLDDLKAQDVVCLPVAHLTTMTDYMIIASGTSTVQVKSMAEHVRKACKEKELESIGSEGMDNAEWVLLDLGDVILHIMLPATREYYELEKLWAIDPDSDAEPA